MLQNLSDELILFIINNKLGLSVSIENKKIIDSCKYFRELIENNWSNAVSEDYKLRNKVLLYNK